MKHRSLKIMAPVALVLLIVPLPLSCDHASAENAIVPVLPPERFKDTTPSEAIVERIDIGRTTNDSGMSEREQGAGVSCQAKRGMAERKPLSGPSAPRGGLTLAGFSRG